MTTAVNVRLIETWHSFDLARKASVVLLRQHPSYQSGISKSVHDPRVEISLEAVPLWKVEHKIGWCEGPGLNATSSRTASDIQGVLLWGGLNVVAIATKARFGIENGSLEDLRGVVGVRLRVLRPIPVSASESTAGP